MIRCGGAAVEPATLQNPSLLLLRCILRGESATTKFFIQLSEKIDNPSKQNAEQKARDHDRLSSPTGEGIFANTGSASTLAREHR
jgi:hypothetical protein